MTLLTLINMNHCQGVSLEFGIDTSRKNYMVKEIKCTTKMTRE
jgi:hypothetical protein